jgi:hypothetical protein
MRSVRLTETLLHFPPPEGHQAAFGMEHYHAMAHRLVRTRTTMPVAEWKAAHDFISNMLAVDNPNFDKRLFTQAVTDPRYRPPKPTAWAPPPSKPAAKEHAASLRATVRALSERTEVRPVNEGIYGPAHYDHMAKLLAQAKNHLPADKWQAVHSFLQSALTADNPQFTPDRLAVASAG